MRTWCRGDVKTIDANCPGKAKDERCELHCDDWAKGLCSMAVRNGVDGRANKDASGVRTCEDLTR